MMRHLHFVINPKAGKGRAMSAWIQLSQEVPKYAMESGVAIRCSHSFTGEDLGAAMFDADSILVSVGGDGSAHYTAQLADKYGVPLAVVAAGTGNDYAANLRYPADLSAIIPMLVHGHASWIDAIRVESVLVLNVAGFGLDAEVVHHIEHFSGLKKAGPMGYGLVVPLVIAKHRPFNVQVRSEAGSIALPEVCMLVVANGERFGGGMKIAPGASLVDGYMDIIAVNNISRFTLLKLFPLLYRGKHIHHPSVQRIRAKELELTFEGAIRSAEYDGEPYPGSGSVRMCVDRLRVLVP